MTVDSNERRVVGYAMMGHAMVHALELSIPILMIRWLLEFSVSTAELGLVVAVGYALFGIGALPAGALVDRFGSRPLIVGCLGGSGPCLLWC
ncbi:MAG: hypothetical protein U5K37_02725 [Natrialbaceae archaeon]|nr:hypothetical protein [Natrialbaceae archaeon]